MPRQMLIVGDQAYADQVRLALLDADQPAKLSVVGDYLMALGQASRVRPEVVIGRLDALGSLRDAVITGLRRLAGDAQLLVTAPSAQESQAIAAVEAGFDGYLLEPFDPAKVAQTLAIDHQPAGLPADHSPKPASARPSESFPPSQGEGHWSQDDAPDAAEWQMDVDGPWPGLDDLPAVQGEVSQPQESAGAQSGRPTSLVEGQGMHVDDFDDAHDAELGDVDLLDQLLCRPQAFREMVLKLVAGRSGVKGVDFAIEAQDVPKGHVGVWATYRGRRLGVLHAPPPTIKSQLQPWASWLAHWLALERKMTTLWDMAHKDELTGAWNRRYFDRHLVRVLQQAAQKRFPVTLLMFDIDNFKTYNDRYGHAAGDEILCETVRLMRSVIREHDMVARIGGDEFAVIFWDPQGPRRPPSAHPDDVRQAARRFQQAICSHRFPKLLEEAPGTLTISGGLASFPWDGATPQALLERADAMLLHSKAHGKNAITYGAGAAREPDPFDI